VEENMTNEKLNEVVEVKVNGKVYRWMSGTWFAPSGLSVWHPNTLAKIEAAVAKTFGF
jgi:hypothetical protein